MVGPDHEQHADASGAAGKGDEPKAPHRHLTAAVWREAYIAKHHHDLPDLRHPGH
jgi:hypothetical protein